MEKVMTTQRKGTRAAAIAIAARRAETATSVDAAENEGLHIWAPATAIAPRPASNTMQHAMLDGNSIGAETALATCAAHRISPPAPESSIAKAPRTIGSFRLRAKWRPVR